jgi:[CysO sulfur-carrier protein]-thiocarboxylate-dependent cysteine synthase
MHHMYFKSAVGALGHTPLVELANLSPNPRVHILAKLEGLSVGGSASIKDRIARSMIDAAERDGRLGPEKRILEATSGNTGIALAWLGRQIGYGVTIVMPENMSVERQRLIRLFGAELILTPAAGGVKQSIDVTNEMAAKDNHYFLTDQFANPANPAAHYQTTGVEILDDFPFEKIDFLVCGIGTGGTIMGLAHRLRERFPLLKVIGVEPPPNDIIQGLRCLEGYVPPVLDLKQVDKRAKVTSKQANDTVMALLRKEGIFAGQSSGAAAYQSMQLAVEIGQGNIVTILPDGGWKYLSMDFWDKG